MLLSAVFGRSRRVTSLSSAEPVVAAVIQHHVYEVKAKYSCDKGSLAFIAPLKHTGLGERNSVRPYRHLHGMAMLRILQVLETRGIDHYTTGSRFQSLQHGHRCLLYAYRKGSSAFNVHTHTHTHTDNCATTDRLLAHP
jgi:hypothetical protein